MDALRNAAQKALSMISYVNSYWRERTSEDSARLGSLEHDLRAALASHPTCIGTDPLCPCQDGDACHYVDSGKTKAMQVPPGMASELLAALQDLVFNTSMGADITKLIAVERARAAIAKAIGQTGERG